MPSNCSVCGCSGPGKVDGEIKFHQFPKDEKFRGKWLSAIKKSEQELGKRPKVCSKHFVESDYTTTRLNYSMSSRNNSTPSKNTCEWKVLKPNAVPSVKLPGKSSFKIKISKKNSNEKEIKIEEVKIVDEKVKMPKRHAVEILPRSRAQSRRAASKEALKQMQLLLDDEDDAVEIPSDDDVIPVEHSPPPPPKKKYKLSHRKSSDGNDRDVIVLKSITNRNVENTLELECWVEQLEEVQKSRIQKLQDEEKQLQEKLDSLIKLNNAEVIHKSDLNTIIEITEQVNAAATQASQSNLIINNNVAGPQQSYQLVMDPRLGLIVGAVTSQATPTTSTNTPPKVYQGKVQIAQGLQQTTTTPTQTTTRGMRTRRGGAAAKNAPSPTPTPPQTRSVLQTRSTPSRASPSVKTPMAAKATPLSAKATPLAAKSTPLAAKVTPLAAKATPAGAKATPAVAKATPASPAKATPAKATPAPAAKATPALLAKATPAPPAKKNIVPTPATRGRPPTNTYANLQLSESSVEGGLAMGGTGKKAVVDLTSEDGRSAPDSREISFNKLQGKTFPSLVVVARPHLRVMDLNVDRPKLDAKVKSVLMHAPTKFTEWLIQQGLLRSEQKCSVHTANQLKLGMYTYSDVSKFPYSGGYVWISECCPQRFVSVFSGSLFEGSPHPPMVLLKLLYHWACQTNIQNVTQWVKIDNLYVKGMFTWLRAVCTVALQTHIRQLGGAGVKVEVGVISLGTTSQDGNQRQVKVEVLGILESNSKLIRLRAVEPQVDGDRNYKKRFSKILEPICQWVHPQSILVADLTVDKQTLHNMGFSHVVQSTSTEYGSNRQIMEYLRRIVPRMFQNTLSLLSRQIIQQFLDELVWREWFGTSSLQAFDNLVIHLSEQTRFDNGQSLISRLNKVAQNPFKNWAIPVGNSTKVVVENIQKKPRARKTETPKVTQSITVDVNRPPKSTSPDVPEQMVPLENYYYGTVDHFAKSTKIVLNMKCPFCKSLFNNNIQLMNHLFKHAHNVSQDAQLCRYCLTSVPTANDLLKHIATSHPAETKFDNGFVCLICEIQYMNPFILGKHMSKEHCPSELPYQCGTCGYRCSNHKQAIDHFYKQHDNGPTIQCPFCLKSTTVFSSSRNIVQNMNYFIQHLQKHQRKQFAKRCGKCNLWFVQKDVLKDHQMRMHVSQRGKNGLMPWNAPRNGVMVPKSKMDKYPCDADVINFGTLYFNVSKNLLCKECNTPMDTPKHFPSFESCQNPNCQYSTCCTNAMQEHNAKCSKSHNPVAEEKLPFEMFCICGHSDTDGNQLARHLAICERKSAYPSRNDSKSAIVTHSMLDVLGLVRKPEEGPSVAKKSSPVAEKKEVNKDEVIDVSHEIEPVVEKKENANEIVNKDTTKESKDKDTQKTIESVSEQSPSIDEEVVIIADKEEEKITEDVKAAKEADKDTEEVEIIEKTVNKVADEADKETEEIEFIGETVNKVADEADKDTEEIEFIEETVSKVADEADKDTEELEFIEEAVNKVADETDKATEEIEFIEETVSKAADEVDKDTEELEFIEEAVNKVADETDKDTEEIEIIEETDEGSEKEVGALDNDVEQPDEVVELKTLHTEKNTDEPNEVEERDETSKTSVKKPEEASAIEETDKETNIEEQAALVEKSEKLNVCDKDVLEEKTTEESSLEAESSKSFEQENIAEVELPNCDSVIDSFLTEGTTNLEVLQKTVQEITEPLSDVNDERILQITDQSTEDKTEDLAIHTVNREEAISASAELSNVIFEKPTESESAPLTEQMSPVNEMETTEIVQEKSNSLEPEITSADIQNLISDVVGEKSNLDISYNPGQNIDEAPSMETETDITFPSTRETQDLTSRHMEDVTMQIARDESMEIPESSNESMASEVVPMETD